MSEGLSGNNGSGGGALLWQRAEGALVFVAGLAIVWSAGDVLPWWAAVLVFFVPDLSFFAYLGGPCIGSAGYNLFHVYAGGAVLLALGLVLTQPLLVVLGGLWLGHCGFDRALGYGLKLPAGFGFTHLGRIGKR